MARKEEWAHISNEFLLAVPFDGKDPAQEDLDRAKQFALKYVVKGIHQMVEQDCTGWEETTVPPTLHERKYHYLDDKLRTALELHYFKHKGKDAAERQAMIEADIRKRLDGITLEDVQIELGGWVGEAERQHGKYYEKWVLASLLGDDEKVARGAGRVYPKLPEWMQMLVQDRGMYVFSYADYDSDPESDLGKMFGGSYNDFRLPHGIYLSPYVKPEGMLHTLREETLHALQIATDAPLMLTDQSLEPRLYAAAAPLLEAMDADSAHPAWGLIKHMEPYGGSVQQDRGIPFRAAELMVDLFDAETYLRIKGGKTAGEAEAEARAAFGDEMFEAGRAYLHAWINQAAGVLEKEAGEQAAKVYKDKWMADPLCHEVSLPKSLAEVGEVNIDARERGK
jgi:hypothetical protein